MKKGISLVVLIITIVVMLILASIVIFGLTGKDNVIDSAVLSSIVNDKAALEDSISIYYDNENSNKIRNLSTMKEIIISNPSSKIITNDAELVISGKNLTLYKLDKNICKNKNIKFPNDVSNALWYVNEEGKVYLVFSSTLPENIASHSQNIDFAISLVE